MHFLPLPAKMGTNFIFQKNNFENSEKLQSIVNIFVFFVKVSYQSKESLPFLNSPPFSSTPPFLFHPHPHCQIRGSQSPLCKEGGWRGGEGAWTICSLFHLGRCNKVTQSWHWNFEGWKGGPYYQFYGWQY